MPASDRDFNVHGVACRTQAAFNVKVGAGDDGTSWPKRLQFTVKLRVGEDHEMAARRWVASERGQQHAAQEVEAAVETAAEVAEPSPSNSSAGEIGLGLFESVGVIMEEANMLHPRERRRPARLESNEGLRDRAFGSRRNLPLPKTAGHEAECERPDCVASRAERDKACAERDEKVAELAHLRGALHGVASSVAGNDACVGVGVQSIQHALMEILDGV